MITGKFVSIYWSYMYTSIIDVHLLQVAWRAYFLGFVFSVGISLSLHTSKPYVTAGLYCIILSVFHFGEYLATAFFNPTELKVDAFIINHSLEYNAALLVSWLEHAAWMYVFPGILSESYFLMSLIAVNALLKCLKLWIIFSLLSRKRSCRISNLKYHYK